MTELENLNLSLAAMTAQMPKGAELRAARECGRNAQVMTRSIKRDVDLINAYRNGLDGRAYAFDHAERTQGHQYPLSAWIELDYLREIADEQYASACSKSTTQLSSIMGFGSTHDLSYGCYRH